MSNRTEKNIDLRSTQLFGAFRENFEFLFQAVVRTHVQFRHYFFFPPFPAAVVADKKRDFAVEKGRRRRPIDLPRRGAICGQQLPSGVPPDPRDRTPPPLLHPRTSRADNNSKVGPWMDGVSVLSVFSAKVDEKETPDKKYCILGIVPCLHVTCKPRKVHRVGDLSFCLTYFLATFTKESVR